MNAKLISKFGFACPECGGIEAPEHELQTVEAYYTTTIGENTYTLAKDLGDPVNIYVYHGDPTEIETDCSGEDEPEYNDAYQCSECNEIYLDETEAEDCCNE